MSDGLKSFGSELGYPSTTLFLGEDLLKEGGFSSAVFNVNNLSLSLPL